MRSHGRFSQPRSQLYRTVSLRDQNYVIYRNTAAGCYCEIYCDSEELDEETNTDAYILYYYLTSKLHDARKLLLSG